VKAMASIRTLGGSIADTARVIWRMRYGQQKHEMLQISCNVDPDQLAQDQRDPLGEFRSYEDCFAAEEELSNIADRAQKQLAAIEKLMGKSLAEADHFGAALQDKASQISTRPDAADLVAGLVELTNTMIEKTRTASGELKSRREEMSALRVSLSEARTRADTDMLTQLRNRHCFERDFAIQIERCTADDTPLSLAICDIDNFKDVNDHFGHQTGDGVLRLVAKILDEHCSSFGSVFRLGGEEFAVLLPDMAAGKAFELIERTRKDLAARKIRERKSGELIGKVTMSGGVATAIQCNGQSADQLFTVADRELYVAKEDGRNRVSSSHVERDT
jgi:diguanylate cyclase